MALLDVDLFSESLEMGTSLTVVLPQSARGQVGVEPVEVPEHGWPVLHLLHGLSDDHSAWLRHTAIERHARATGVAVVMPAAGRSFYADEVHGHAYWTWVSEELPLRVAEMFRLSTRPEDTYVAGLSMGGYGALKLALTHPRRYAGVASLSGAVDVRVLHQPERAELLHRIFDGRIPPGADLDHLLDEADPASLPPVWLGCGTEDVLHDANVRLAERLRSGGVDLTTDFRPGDHEWGLWDRAIADVIAWLPGL